LDRDSSKRLADQVVTLPSPSLIRLNRETKTKGIHLTKQEHLDFDHIRDGPFEIDEASLPNSRLNFLNVESAIEIYTPLLQLFFANNDFRRACNSLHWTKPLSFIRRL